MILFDHKICPLSARADSPFAIWTLMHHSLCVSLIRFGTATLSALQVIIAQYHYHTQCKVLLVIINVRSFSSQTFPFMGMFDLDDQMQTENRGKSSIKCFKLQY